MPWTIFRMRISGFVSLFWIRPIRSLRSTLVSVSAIRCFGISRPHGTRLNRAHLLYPSGAATASVYSATRPGRRYSTLFNLADIEDNRARYLQHSSQVERVGFPPGSANGRHFRVNRRAVRRGLALWFVTSSCACFPTCSPR